MNPNTTQRSKKNLQLKVVDRPWVVTVSVGDDQCWPTNVTIAQSLKVCPGRLLTGRFNSARHGYPCITFHGVGRPIKLKGGKSLVDILSHVRGAPFDIWRGGLKKKWKKKFVENVVKKKVCCRNWWKICWPEKTPNSNVHNRKGIQQKYIFQFFFENLKQNCRMFITKKKIVFFGKKKFATNKNSLPPYLMVRPWLLKGWIMSLCFLSKQCYHGSCN